MGKHQAAQATPGAALDLPLRVFVREDKDGRPRVPFRPIVQSLEKFHVEEQWALRIASAHRILLKATHS